MKFAYKFNNLLGTVYRKGNLIFSTDGNSVISPVGNRLTIYDLKNNKSQTLSTQSKFNCTAVDISPNGCLMVVTCEDGQAYMISMVSQTVIHKYKFKKEPACVKFSPDGKLFGVCVEHLIYIFKTPGMVKGQFNTFATQRIFHDTQDDIVWLDWSDDSRCILVGSRDNSCKIYAMKFLENFRPYVISGHNDEIVSCSFEENSLNANTVSRNGQVVIWECSLKPHDLIESVYSFVKTEPEEKRRKGDESQDEDDEIDVRKAIEKTADEMIEYTKSQTEQMPDENAELRDAQGKLITIQSEEVQNRKLFYYKKLTRHYLMDELKKEHKNVKLTAATYHKKLKLLVTAYSTGAFYLHELPEATLIHSLNISEYAINSVCFNSTGDWIALGVAGAGQLLVWEWQSEQYVMKQQGHSNVMSTISYSADGNFIVTGGFDGKIKVWNVTSGFCFVTFNEHTSGVTALKFSRNKKYFVSSSLDGTVRAFDMTRYRNFKTFTGPRLVQFSCVAVDYSGELVAAGAQDVFEIYLWSMKFGRILEVLSGHEGPVMSLDFSPVPTSSTLVSGGWDKIVKIWNCLESSSGHETIDMMSDVVCVAIKPNGEEVAVATLNCTISVFNVKSAQQVYTIECKNDVGISMSDGDVISAKKSSETKHFTAITYSADGECIIAGGKSKFVCIYHVREGLLLKKFEITQNMSLDGMTEFINRRNMSDFGNLALIEERDTLEGGNVKINLPGTQKNDIASRNYKPEVGVHSLEFSPNGQQWAAATSEGLMIYSLDKGIVFDPYQLSIEVTPKSTRALIDEKEYSGALIMALKLNEVNLVQEIIEQIPYRDIDLVLESLPENFVKRTAEFVTKMIASHHIEFYLKWTRSLLTKFGSKTEVVTPQLLINLHQNLNRKYDSINKVCDFNKYTMSVIRSMAAAKLKAEVEETPDSDEDDTEMRLMNNDASNDEKMSDDDTSEE